MFIHNLAKLRVCWNRLYPEDGAQVITLDLLLKASLKLKQGRILQVKHREGAAVAILQSIGDTHSSARIGDQIYPFTQSFQQSAKSKLFRASSASPPHNT